MALASGTKLGPYEITAPLGAGGMGEVYRARDKRLGRTWQSKYCHLAFLKTVIACGGLSRKHVRQEY